MSSGNSTLQCRLTPKWVALMQLCFNSECYARNATRLHLPLLFSVSIAYFHPLLHCCKVNEPPKPWLFQKKVEADSKIGKFNMIAIGNAETYTVSAWRAGGGESVWHYGRHQRKMWVRFVKHQNNRNDEMAKMVSTVKNTDLYLFLNERYYLSESL